MRTNRVRMLTVVAAVMVVGAPMLASFSGAEVTATGLNLYLTKTASGKFMLSPPAPTAAAAELVDRAATTGGLCSTSTTFARPAPFGGNFTMTAAPKVKIYITIPPEAQPVYIGVPSPATDAGKYGLDLTMSFGATQFKGKATFDAKGNQVADVTMAPSAGTGPWKINGEQQITLSPLAQWTVPGGTKCVTLRLNSTAEPSQAFFAGAFDGPIPPIYGGGPVVAENNTTNETGNETTEANETSDNTTTEESGNETSDSGEPDLDVEGNATANTTGDKKAKDEGLLPGFGAPLFGLAALAAVALMRRRRRT